MLMKKIARSLMFMVDTYVQERGAARRLLDLALDGPVRAGERALLVPEQLRFQQRLGDRRAVDRDEAAARAEAKVVRAGKRLIVTSVDVTDVTRDRLAARATLTFAVLEPR